MLTCLFSYENNPSRLLWSPVLHIMNSVVNMIISFARVVVTHFSRADVPLFVWWQALSLIRISHFPLCDRPHLIMMLSNTIVIISFSHMHDLHSCYDNFHFSYDDHHNSCDDSRFNVMTSVSMWWCPFWYAYSSQGVIMKKKNISLRPDKKIK